MPNAVRIIGFDPGIGRTGYGIIEIEGNTSRSVGHGLIETPPGDSPADRQATMASEVRRVLAEAGATEAAVEKLIFSKNVTTGMTVAEARGVIRGRMFGRQADRP